MGVHPSTVGEDATSSWPPAGHSSSAMQCNEAAIATVADAGGEIEQRIGRHESASESTDAALTQRERIAQRDEQHLASSSIAQAAPQAGHGSASQDARTVPDGGAGLHATGGPEAALEDDLDALLGGRSGLSNAMPASGAAALPTSAEPTHATSFQSGTRSAKRNAEGSASMGSAARGHGAQAPAKSAAAKAQARKQPASARADLEDWLDL